MAEKITIELPDQNQEGTLLVGERDCLDELMRNYRPGLAQAIEVAVSRGIRPRLN